jgi:hypothetical protein
MARSFGGVLGNFKGKLGKVSARIVKGDTILSARPSSFRESTKPKHVEAKQKFAVTIAFASSVAQLPALYESWKMKKDPALSVINTICQTNYGFSSTQAPTLNNIITPVGGFGTPFTAAQIANGKLTGTLAPLNSVSVISNDAVDLSINAVICLSDPKKGGDPLYKIINVSKDVAGFQFTQQYNFEIDLDVEKAAEVAKYNVNCIYLAVATKSADGDIIKYSNSYSIQSN